MLHVFRFGLQFRVKPSENTHCHSSKSIFILTQNVDVGGVCSFLSAKTEKVLQQYVTNRTPEPWKCWYIKLYKLVTQISTHKVTE